MTSNENLNSRPRSRPRPIRCLFLGPPCVGKGTQARLLIQQHHEQEANHHDSGKFVLISSGDLLRLHTNNGSGKSDNKNGSSGTDVNNNNNDSSSGRSTSPTTATATTSPVAVAFTRKNLAPLVLELLEQELSKLDRDRDGFILDVSLRSTNEVKQVDSILHKLGLSLDCVIQFRMDDLESTDASTRDLALREIAKRGAGRLVHLPSGRTYHPIYAPPKVEGKDDITGDDLVQRNDDSATNDGFEAMQRRLELYHRGSVPVIEYLRAKGRQLYNDDEHGAPLVRELHLKVDHTIQETNTALSEIIRSSPLRPNYEPGSAPAVVVVERRAPPDASTIEQLLQNEETAALMVLAGTTTCKKLVVGDPEYMRIVQQVLQVSGSRKKDASFPGRQVAYLGREALAEVLRHIHNAVYSMKADGTRYLAWIESSSPAPTTKEEDTAAATATTANVYLINRKMEVFKFSTSGILAQFANSLLDGELVVETQQTTTKDANNNNNTSVKDLLRFRFIICDALNVRGQDKVQMRLVDRLAEVNAFFFSNKQQQRGGSIDDGEEEKYDENRLAVSPQRYYPLKNLTTVQALMSDPPLPYATDGLIIQSAVYPPYYRHGFDRNCYKWKPMEKDTVDFQINITTITVVRNKDDKHDDLASDTEQRVVVELHVFDHVTRKPQPFAYLALGDEFHHDESELAAKFGVTRLQGAIVECYWNKDVETLTPTPVYGPVASPSSSAAADAKTTDESDETSKKPLIYRLEKTKGGWCIARLRTDKSTPNVRWVVESIVKNAKEDRITRDELIAGICAEAAASSAASAASTTATKTTTTTTTTTMTRQRPSPITPATTSARARWTATSDDTSSSSAAAESDDGWRTVSNRHSSSSGSTQHHHQQQRQPRGGAAQRGGSNNGHRHGNNNHSNNTTRCASASLARRSNGSSDDWRKK